MPRGLCRASGAKGEGLLHPLYRRFPQKIPLFVKNPQEYLCIFCEIANSLTPPPRVVKYGYSLKLCLTVLKKLGGI